MALIVGGILLLVLLGFALRNLWRTPAPEVPLERPLDLPVEEPEIASMEEVADAMEGKPVPPEFPMTLPPFTEDDHIRGERFSEFSIVEYSNYGNKYALLLHPDLRSLVDESNGTINWVVRHYPVTVAHYLPAQAAECAYFQNGHDAFWTYFNASFSLQNPTQLTLTDLAASQGLDRATFTTCLDKDFTRDRVLADLQDGRLDAKIRVTPSYVVINNLTGKMRLVEGLNTIDYLREVLEVVR